MSLPIWTPDALLSEIRPYENRVWRFVEAQHRVSTLKLVDDLPEQFLLEEILESSKPPVPDACGHLDYLLSTPFRYRPYPNGSRFRRAGITPGVWYGAEEPEVALSEVVFYRMLFFAESPDISFPDDASEYTAFAVDVKTTHSLDLTAGVLAKHQADWQRDTDYEPCQSLADAARQADVEIIRYSSLRDQGHRANVAILACSAFSSPAPVERASWQIKFGHRGVQAICEHPRLALEFSCAELSAHKRLADMVWDRPRT